MPPWWQVDQALVELTSRVRLHSERSHAGQWARVADDSEVRGISEERIGEVTVLSGCSCVPMRPLGASCLPCVRPFCFVRLSHGKAAFVSYLKHCEL